MHLSTWQKLILTVKWKRDEHTQFISTLHFLQLSVGTRAEYFNESTFISTSTLEVPTDETEYKPNDIRINNRGERKFLSILLNDYFQIMALSSSVAMKVLNQNNQTYQR